jgi:phosphoribosylanthranilate isomerase
VAKVLDLPWLEDDEGHLDRAAATEGRILLAGGLDPGNVRAAIESVEPWAVDSSRGTEASPGIKDHAKVRAFVEAAR